TGRTCWVACFGPVSARRPLRLDSGTVEEIERVAAAGRQSCSIFQRSLSFSIASILSKITSSEKRPWRQGLFSGAGDSRSAKRSERRPKLVCKDLRLLPGGEVTALVDLVVVDDVRVGGLDPTPRGLEDLAGEGRETDRDVDRRRRLAGGASGGLCALPIRPRRRGAGTCQPVERDVVEEVIAREIS